ncbi:MAG: NADH-quinone oxidoreductase subunit H [Candidatus Omnitrophica bacterium]|nr:NADH-quinone oxidoreductase subunit H [Candidatus Omnitrophota bacterium]
MTPTKILLLCIQVFFLVLFAPLVSGFIRKVKNNLRMRKGASIFQPYYNFIKLLSKDQIVSKHTSWIFTVTPAIVLASSLCACFLLPVFQPQLSLNTAGDLLAIFFILALGRFFLALAALDAGSSFGGMGSSREMFISSIAEPAAFVSLFVIGMNSNSTSAAAVAGAHFIQVSTVLAGFAFFMIAIAETSRIPIDNQETHLELTMVHEAMVLEYSGRSLAIIELAGHIRQIIFFTMLSWFLFPFLGDTQWQWLQFPLKLLVISIIIAVLEISLAKMRLFRVVDYLGFAFFIALLAATAACMGM